MRVAGDNRGDIIGEDAPSWKSTRDVCAFVTSGGMCGNHHNLRAKDVEPTPDEKQGFHPGCGEACREQDKTVEKVAADVYDRHTPQIGGPKNLMLESHIATEMPSNRLCLVSVER